MKTALQSYPGGQMKGGRGSMQDVLDDHDGKSEKDERGRDDFQHVGDMALFRRRGIGREASAFVLLARRDALQRISECEVERPSRSEGDGSS